VTETTLFDRLPVVYRIRDAELSGELEALIGLVDEQVGLLDADIAGLWDDMFIETCAEWVVPYIGDLVSNTPLYEVEGVSRRADVGNTIHWRRRKGTLTMLGALAREVTGWGGTAVAMFELLSWNQNLNHLRMLAAVDTAEHPHPYALDRVATVNVRDRDLIDRIDSAWDRVTHTVDVRPIGDEEGWYGIRKVCFFVFRLRSYALVATTPTQSASGPASCFHFHQLGHDAPLFHVGTTVPQDELATEDGADAPIRPYRFYEHPEFDWNESLRVRHGPAGTLVPVTDVLCKDLSAWPAVPPDKIGVDVRTGRYRVGSALNLDAPVTVDYAYGFSAPIGGGPYDRQSGTAAAARPNELQLRVRVDGLTGAFTTVQDAVAYWKGQPPQDVRIVIGDSQTYQLPSAGLSLNRPGLTEPLRLTIVAADGQRPLLVGNIRVDSTELGSVTLDGLLISGSLSVSGPVEEVAIADCTLVPGLALDEAGDPVNPTSASVVCDEPTARRDIELVRSITGPLRIAEEANHLVVSDGIVDAPPGGAQQIAIAADDTGAPGPETTLERVTVLGDVSVRELTLASDSIFLEGTVQAERTQAGCMRFCSLPLDGARTPRRYRCQPDLVRTAAPDPETAAVETLRVRPWFVSRRYGQPAYLQLATGCANEIRAGADDGAEMGAFHMLDQPFRETNLRVRLEEYLPFGLEPGIVHVT
jgi:hypothetical protein